MIINPYQKITFLKSAAKLEQLPEDFGYEIAFAGRSNAGKSTALNTLTGIKGLARTSKTPGCTQLINVFPLDNLRRLIDLPGYGYAKVALKIKQAWQKNLATYLEQRICLKGVVLLMDCRHPLKESDKMMIDWSIEREIPLHLVLTKGDKLNKNELNNTVDRVSKAYDLLPDISIQTLSSLKKQGIEKLIQRLNQWFELE